MLAMVLLWIWQWWRLGDPFNVRLGGVGVYRWPLASASTGNPSDSLNFLSFKMLSAMFFRTSVFS
jgi:hypothetical protein